MTFPVVTDTEAASIQRQQEWLSRKVLVELAVPPIPAERRCHAVLNEVSAGSAANTAFTDVLPTHGSRRHVLMHGTQKQFVGS